MKRESSDLDVTTAVVLEKFDLAGKLVETVTAVDGKIVRVVNEEEGKKNATD